MNEKQRNKKKSSTSCISLSSHRKEEGEIEKRERERAGYVIIFQAVFSCFLKQKSRKMV